MIDMRIREFMRRQKHKSGDLARALAEHLGIERLSRPGLYEMDKKLSRYLDYRGGYFIECGANDGFRQSNTYYLERFLSWTGLLIEPVPELYERCRTLRRNATCVQAALIGPEYSGNKIEITYAGLMSVVGGAFSDQRRAREHVDEGLRIQGISSYRVAVPAFTLSGLLDKQAISREIDFFSLDVEGFELEVLKGLDLARHAPRLILVEARDPQSIATLLATRYEMVEQLTHHDYLFARTDD